MEIIKNGVIENLEELSQVFKIKEEILNMITNTPINMINNSYKKCKKFCYVCADGRCLEIQVNKNLI